MHAHFLLLLALSLSAELGVEGCSRRRKGSRLAPLARDETCECVPLRTCPPFLAALGANLTSTRLRALQKATCDPIGDPDNPDVRCCDKFLKMIDTENEVLAPSKPKPVVDFDKFCSQFEPTLFERIVGGKDAAIGQFPWIARLGYTEERGMDVKDATFMCAGSLISNEHVLTAAHCLARAKHDSQLEWVVLGEVDERTDPDCESNKECAAPILKRRVAWKVAHADYSNISFRNDIGLVKLEEPVKFSNWVHPICLPKKPEADLTNTKAVVAGWGRIMSVEGAPPKYTSKLQFLWKRVWATEACEARYHRGLGGRHLCAGGNKGEDSCNGDSGGPLALPDPADTGVEPYSLIGIVSYGAKDCGQGLLPGVYTRVDAFLDWIRKVVAADPPNSATTLRI